MKAIKERASEIVCINNSLKQQQIQNHDGSDLMGDDSPDVIQSNDRIRELRSSIEVYQREVFTEISSMLEDEWRKQQEEAGFWLWLNKKNKTKPKG